MGAYTERRVNMAEQGRRNGFGARVHIGSLVLYRVLRRRGRDRRQHAGRLRAPLSPLRPAPVSTTCPLEKRLKKQLARSPPAAMDQ
jgi:hypothetical protein